MRFMISLAASSAVLLKIDGVFHILTGVMKWGLGRKVRVEIREGLEYDSNTLYKILDSKKF